MSVTEETRGVVRDRGGVTWLDTRAMEWEPMPAIPGYFQKTLVRDEDGEPTTTINYVAPGQLWDDAELPHRHMHSTVREMSYVLEGEYKGCEYASAEQIHGDRMTKKKGMIMDRQPGSLHGAEAGPRSLTGCVFLTWRIGGPGIWIGEKDFETESAVVPYPESSTFTPGPHAPHEAGAACIHNRGGQTVLDTREMEWEPMPALPGYAQKVLIRDADGEPSATLNYLPAGPPRSDVPFKLPYKHYHRSVREFCFVLEGEFATYEYEDADAKGELVWKRAGYFMDRRPGSIHGIEEPAPSSPTGAVLLNWRVGGSGIWFGEKDFETETVQVP